MQWEGDLDEMRRNRFRDWSMSAIFVDSSVLIDHLREQTYTWAI